MQLRRFVPEDLPAVQRMFVSAFGDAEGEQEGLQIGELVNDLVHSSNTADLYGFVALEGQEVLGAIFFSRLTFDSAISAFILSPVAVRTEKQGIGIGQKLILHGLNQLANEGVEYVATYGDPAYYSRVGFRSVPCEVVIPPFELSQPVGWLGQSLNGRPIDAVTGACTCVTAFNNPAYW